MDSVIHSQKSLLFVAEHTLLIYLAVILGLRLVGRRQLSQLNVMDLVVIVVMGSAVETSMVAGDTSLPAGLVSTITLLLANRLLNTVTTRSRRLRHLLGGGPILLVHNGSLVDANLRRDGLTLEDVLEAIRERGFDCISSIRFAVLEADGSIHVVPKLGTV